MEQYYTITDAIGDTLPIVYSLIFVVAIYRFRQVNSLVVVASLLLVIDATMNYIRDPLFALESRELWYGSWLMLNGLTMYLIFSLHKWLGLELSKEAKTVAQAYLFLAFLQVGRYIDRSFLGGHVLEEAYLLLIPAINISVAALLIGSLFKKEITNGVRV